MLLIFGAMLLISYANNQSVSKLLSPYDIQILINELPNISRDNQSLISYTFEQFKQYIIDLNESGKIPDIDVSLLISTAYQANEVGKFLLESKLIDWDVYLYHYFYPLPTNIKAST